jgi:hypothetical protein
VKPSGAPETGDLVQLKKNPWKYKGWWKTGLIIECRGIKCCVLWNAGPQNHTWWPRTKLEVINETVN